MIETEDQHGRLVGLARFLPHFEDPDFTFGEWVQPPSPIPGAQRMPFFSMSRTASALIEDCYKLGWVRSDFDWGQWTRTHEATTLRDKPDAIAEASADQLAKLLTTVIRQERFCDGSLAAAYDSGMITAILRRAAVLASEG